jgi:hypothetical protein
VFALKKGRSAGWWFDGIEQKAGEVMQHIENALMAGIPILYVTSPEEDRVIAAVAQCSRKLGRKLWLHTVSEGLWTVDLPSAGEILPETVYGKPNPDFRDPIALLRNIKSMHVPKRGAIYLLLDFHEYLGDAVARRHLRDLGAILRAGGSSIMILAPITALPPSLENDVWCCSLPLPSSAELAAGLRRFAGRDVTGELQQALTDKTLAAMAEAGRGMTLKQFEWSVNRAVALRQGTIEAGIVDDIVRDRQDALRQSAALEWVEPPMRK